MGTENQNRTGGTNMVSRIAILTDVHGNAPALRAVIADMDREGGIEHVYCIGDMVDIGPDSNEVLSLLCARDDVTMLMGNHDQYVLAAAGGRDLEIPAQVREHAKWIAERLDPRFIPVLAALPLQLTVHHGGRTLLLLHYHLTATNQFASIEWEPSLASLEERYRSITADAVCFGHHHPVHLLRSERRVYLNPGALGCCDRPVARYGILTLDPNRVEVELREVPYDNRDFLASYDRLEVPAREFILKVFHGH